MGRGTARARDVLLACLVSTPLVACGSPPAGSASVTGGEARILTASMPPSGDDMTDEATLQLDPSTRCVVDEHGRPMAFPEGTDVSGGVDDWVVTTTAGDTFRAGDRVQGGGDAAHSMSYLGDPPTDCGAPPWHLMYEGVRSPRSEPGG